MFYIGVLGFVGRNGLLTKLWGISMEGIPCHDGSRVQSGKEVGIGGQHGSSLALKINDGGFKGTAGHLKFVQHARLNGLLLHNTAAYANTA